MVILFCFFFFLFCLVLNSFWCWCTWHGSVGVVRCFLCLTPLAPRKLKVSLKESSWLCRSCITCFAASSANGKSVAARLVRSAWFRCEVGILLSRSSVVSFRHHWKDRYDRFPPISVIHKNVILRSFGSHPLTTARPNWHSTKNHPNEFPLLLSAAAGATVVVPCFLCPATSYSTKVGSSLERCSWSCRSCVTFFVASSASGESVATCLMRSAWSLCRVEILLARSSVFNFSTSLERLLQSPSPYTRHTLRILDNFGSRPLTGAGPNGHANKNQSVLPPYVQSNSHRAQIYHNNGRCR